MKFVIKTVIVVALVAFIVVLRISSNYYPQIYEFISVIVKDPLWASVFVTMILVAINAYYAWQVRQTICEMEKARKAEFLPHVRVKLSWLGPVFLVLELTNFGRGPVVDINAQITFLPSNEKRLLEQSIMSPGESIRISLPEGNVDKVGTLSAQIQVEGKYRDIFGQTFQINEVIDTMKFIKQAEQLHQLAEKDVPMLIENIKSELEKIGKTLDKIEYNQRYVKRQGIKDNGLTTSKAE
ncbi:MAG: hypothetical protein QXF82_04475 [Nitrososphaeria archaeon]